MIHTVGMRVGGGLRRLALAAAGVAAAMALSLAVAEAAGDKAEDDLLGKSTWNPLNPASVGHFRVADPANVSPEQAEAIYQALAKDMAERYRLSGIESAAEYLSWTRYSTAPYRSVPHGRRYLNNYANAAAGGYGRYEDAGIIPPGAVLAKDSFSISKSGEVVPGPLFLMEKMERGFKPESGDWRYTLILPDGSVLGTTEGENARNVAFCIKCHADAGEGQDHMFLPPKKFRRKFSDDAK